MPTTVSLFESLRQPPALAPQQSQKMLTQTLRSLERDGLVSRQIWAAVPPRVEYTLTPLGHTFTGPLRVVEVWAETHVEEIEASSAAWDRLSCATRPMQVSAQARLAAAPFAADEEGAVGEKGRPFGLRVRRSLQ